VTDPREMDAFLTGLMPRLAAMARDGFGNPGPVTYKSPGQPVTATDRAIEEVAVEAILGTWPDHAIIGEETGHTEGEAETIWFIDPIDGTLNFTRGIPIFSISVGAVQRGKPVVGHVMDPLREEHFHAFKGSGARLGENPVTLSDVRDIDQAALSMQTSAEGLFLQKPGFVRQLHRRFSKTRKLGTIALELAYVAAGRFDLLFAGKATPQAWWDIAAGWMLVEEAGGILVDHEGRAVTRESSHLVAGHESLVTAFLDLFRGADG
jgi:myo-inositol-1(or 4)-monophosphatase